MIETYTLTTADAEQWRALLPAEARVMASVEYLRICEQQTGWPARLFVVADGAPVAAYPYLLRSVGTLPFAHGLDQRWSDTCTPEYCGPLLLGDRSHWPEEAPPFAELFARHCRAEGIIAEFAHLHPWDVPAEMIDPAGVQPDREIVWADLTGSAEDLWSRSLTSDGRRQTKQGLAAGVTVRRAASAGDVREFHRLYTHTMECRNASERYFFPAEYFLGIHETMPGQAFFVLAEYEGRVVAGGLYFHDRTDSYWHLSAADREWLRVRPVNVYHYETMRAELGSGRRRMVMGGAYQGEDGIFRFKTNFSPLRANFRTYRRTHDPAACAALTEAWSRHYSTSAPPGDFFPGYRSVPQAEAAESVTTA